MRRGIRKPRIDEIRVDFGRDQTISGMQVADDGTLTFFDEKGCAVEPSKIEIGSVYARQKKEAKTITRQAAESSSIQLQQNQALTRFTHVVAVDTNTKVMGSHKISITAAALVRDVVIENGRWHAKLVPQDAFEFHDASEPPEKIGWCEVIGLICRSGFAGKIGIVVDAHLGDLSVLNARQSAICCGFFLPEAFELLYGSSDTGTVEYIGNAAIADCDRVSRRLLARVGSGNFVSTQYASAAPGSSYRLCRWFPAGALR